MMGHKICFTKCFYWEMWLIILKLSLLHVHLLIWSSVLVIARANEEYSDQPAHSRSLGRVFTVCLNNLWILGSLYKHCIQYCIGNNTTTSDLKFPQKVVNGWRSITQPSPYTSQVTKKARGEHNRDHATLASVQS